MSDNGRRVDEDEQYSESNCDICQSNNNSSLDRSYCDIPSKFQ